jgi:hypothetical protein
MSRVTSIKAPAVRSIIAKPIGADGQRVRKSPAAGAFRLLVGDMRKALAFKDARKKLDAILIRADTGRRAGTISELEYHSFCSKWHAALVDLMKQGAK